MKELSIEEKAQRYDGAIKRANAAYKDEDRHLKATLERIFPELKESKESEDENIRKELLKIAKESEDSFYMVMTPDKRKHLIDWLEKQGEHANFRNKIQVGDQVTRNKDGMLVNLSQLKRVAKKDEKQGGQKPVYHKFRVGDKVKKGYLTYTVEDINEESYKLQAYSKDGDKGSTVFLTIGYEKDYELVEKKPADKVESKFKVGDWVVYDHRAYQVVELPKEGYINLCLRRNGKIEFAPSPYCRHWTIKDAKNGDVLSYKDEISLYKHDIENYPKQETTFGGFVYHCCYDGKRFITDSLYSLTEQDKMDIHPATKEQRDLLFQKMKESGYEWDAEKKKLKEIEEEVNGEDYGIDSLYHAQRILEKTLGKVDGYQSDDGILEHKCAISAIKKLYEQKPAWSEEDENLFRCAIDAVKQESKVRTDGCLDEEVGGMVTNWLKSLKDRIQPKQEWKQENTGDLTEFENAMMHIGESFFGQHAGLDPNNTNAIKEQANTLLEFVSSKEWSEEDERQWNNIWDVLDGRFELSEEGYRSAANWFKSIKNRYTWKPSEEQIKVNK